VRAQLQAENEMSTESHRNLTFQLERVRASVVARLRSSSANAWSVAAVGLITMWSFACAAQTDYINDFMKANRPVGRGEPFILDEEVGYLRGGYVQMQVVLYTYGVVEGGDANHPQFLVVFEPRDGGHRASRWILVGLKGAQMFDKVKIDGMTISLIGKKWLPGDAMCCPSQPARVQYVYLEDQLVAVAD